MVYCAADNDGVTSSAFTFSTSIKIVNLALMHRSTSTVRTILLSEHGDRVQHNYTHKELCKISERLLVL